MDEEIIHINTSHLVGICLILWKNDISVDDSPRDQFKSLSVAHRATLFGQSLFLLKVLGGSAHVR